MSLPLAVRKDIRDNEPKIQEANKKINTTLGFDVVLDVPNESIHAVLTEANNSKKDSFTVPVSQYFDGLQKQFEEICKDPLVKEELTRAMSAKKIAYVLRKEEIPGDKKADFGDNTYVGVEFKDGVLNIIVPVSKFWTNITNISNPKEMSIEKVLSRTCVPAGGLPLAVRVNQQKAKAKEEENMKKINAAIGTDFTFDYDAAAIYNGLTNPDYKTAFPLHIANSYLENLSKNLADSLKDDMLKEEFLSVATAKKISVRLVPEWKDDKIKQDFGGNGYIGLQFDNGVLFVQTCASKWWTNVAELANAKDGVSLLKVLSRCHTPAKSLPLNLRQALRNTDAKRAEATQKCAAALGIPLVLDFDPLAFYEGVSDHPDKDRFPEASCTYITNLSANLAGACKDDMIKEALVDAIKSKKLKFQFVKGTFPDAKKYGGDTYIGVSFENGDLSIVIPTKNFWTNMNNISQIKLEKML